MSAGATSMTNASEPLGLVATLFAEEGFRPSEPKTLEQAGLSESLVESLVCKQLAAMGTASGRALARELCLPFGLLEGIYQSLRTRQLLTYSGSAALNDYQYTLTEHGRERAHIYQAACSYLGSAPVPLAEYVTSVDAQTITAEAPRRPQLEEAFRDISIDPQLFDRLGPAINSGAGLFLYGAPGNGKTTLAERITLCFGRAIWLPRVLLAEGELIKLYDPAYHEFVETSESSLLKEESYDRRWVRVRRPTVIAGGELTMDGLEIRHDPNAHVGEAPLQLKSNCGTLLIDDFGRQRMNPVELLNRWIVPLEKRYDFLTLASGKKIQVPFDQLIIFSTNLEPKDLVDEAFLRRIPYKINIANPDEQEFHRLFQLAAPALECEYDKAAVDYLIERHYRTANRPMRRCHPRDLLLQIHNYCVYNDVPMEMKPEYFDLVVPNYFTVVG
jgi:predicted ATPase with chaperone activity